jgi:hypothetical protein
MMFIQNQQQVMMRMSLKLLKTETTILVLIVYLVIMELWELDNNMIWMFLIVPQCHQCH